MLLTATDSRSRQILEQWWYALRVLLVGRSGRWTAGVNISSEGVPSLFGIVRTNMKHFSQVKSER